MVYLKKIETKGFKSMGTTVQSVVVDNGFVAITGPNGSGKSNLLDAILFALGENSAKTLRVPNLSALIYDASEEEQKPSSARVSLQFDNVDRRIPVDFDTATITRELKPSGESIYWLNGKHAQRNNLSELLEMALINSRGLNIVLQGMITRISELIPDEKRKLIEQMVGVAQFDEKKQLALKQLQDADVKLEVAMAKIGEIRERVQLLEEQRNDQLRLKQLEDLTKWLKAVSISSKLVAVERVKESRRASISEGSTKLEQAQIQLANLKTEEENLEQEKNELVRSAVDSGTIELESRIGKIQNDINALTKERQNAVDTINRNDQVIPALDKMALEQREKIDRQQASILSIEEKIRQKEVEKKQVLDLQLSLATERAIIDREISVVRAKIESFRKLREAYLTKTSKIRDNVVEQRSRLETAKNQMNADRAKVKFYEENLASAESSLNDLEEMLSTQTSQLGELQVQKERISKLENRIEQQLEIATSILSKAETAVIKYDSDLSAIENVGSEEMALSRLENLGKEEALEGYLGPLRKLVSFDPKYRPALVALSKGWLNSIIVTDMQSLSRITQVARRLQISRLTIIPLSEVGDVQGINFLDSNLLPATEVIECDPALRNVVNFVLGDSVIVSTPREAFVAAKKGFRAATLTGDLFEREVLAFETGYSKSLANVADILDQQQSFENIRSALVSLKRIIEKRKGALSDLQVRAESFDEKKSNQGLDISRTEAKIENSRQNLKRYRQYSESFASKISQTELEISALEKKLSTSQKFLKAHEQALEKITKLASEIDYSQFEKRNADYNSKKSSLESTLDAITEEIRDYNTDLIRARSDIENSFKPALLRLVDQRNQSEESTRLLQIFLAETEPKLESARTELAKLREEEAAKLEKANRFKPLLESMDGKLKTLRSEIDLAQRRIVAIQRELDTATIDLEKLGESSDTLRGQLSIVGYDSTVEPFENSDNLLHELDIELESLKNNVNFLADANYTEIFENYKYSSVRKNELEKERNAIVNFIESIDAEKQKVFVEAFDRINKELGLVFSKITGGSSWLELERPDSLFDGGIFLMTQFPGQLPRDSSSVSGGQKTIAAVSFILAIQAVFPSPFYVFDEIDAPLDSNYSGKMAEILAERSKYSQIVIVSLKDTVVARASSVIGVYMTQGCSKLIRYKSPMEVELHT